MGLGVTVAVGNKGDAELSSAAWIGVYEAMGDMTTYRLRYDFDVSSGDFPLLADGRIGPGSELSIVEPVDGQDNYLVKGPVTGQQIHFEHGSDGSWVEVFGADTSIAMDREVQTVVWSDFTDSDAVSSILSKYGYTADVDSTNANHPETKHSMVQQDTDFRFVRRLARRNGCLFWISVDSSGTETAHFKRPPVEGDAAGHLIINLDKNNLSSFELEWDVERPTSVIASELDYSAKSDIDGSVEKSPLTPLGKQALIEIAPETRSIQIVTPVDDAGDLKARGEAALIEGGWFIRGSCSSTLRALAKPVRVHTLVNVRGLGTRHSGKYLVSAVRHSIDQSEHRMEIELVRNGWGN